MVCFWCWGMLGCISCLLRGDEVVWLVCCIVEGSEVGELWWVRWEDDCIYFFTFVLLFCCCKARDGVFGNGVREIQIPFVVRELPTYHDLPLLIHTNTGTSAGTSLASTVLSKADRRQLLSPTGRHKSKMLTSLVTQRKSKALLLGSANVRGP